MFADVDPAELTGKERAAFRGGFLGVASLGWSTLVQIVEAGEQDRAAVVEALAEQLKENFRAPHLAAPRAPAGEGIAFAASLRDHPKDRLIAARRTCEDGPIREAFRPLRPRGTRKPMRAFSFLEVEGEEETGEVVDLVKFAKDRHKER